MRSALLNLPRRRQTVDILLSRIEYGPQCCKQQLSLSKLAPVKHAPRAFLLSLVKKADNDVPPLDAHQAAQELKYPRPSVILCSFGQNVDDARYQIGCKIGLEHRRKC